jgi:mono/diheme cytochrome c family protein
VVVFWKIPKAGEMCLVKKFYIITLVMFVFFLSVVACSSALKTTIPAAMRSSAEITPNNVNTTSTQTSVASVLPSTATPQPTISATASVSTPTSGDVANGEQLYFRSIDNQGKSISYTGGPAFGGMMMGAYLTCASCHGPEGHGGKHIMHMQVMDAPPIYYDGLVEMAKSDAGKSAYTIEDFRKAVIQGQDVDGSALNQDMPRWQMSDQDLNDLFAFLKTIH